MPQQETKSNQARPTHTVENYLMTMQVMERDQGEIISARLAEMLNVSPATVTMTLKRMLRDNWITGKGRKGIHLTETGRAAAHSVTRRHMLTEWMLLKILKVPLPEIHDQAHNIEHAISPQLEERMRHVLGDPQVCPHGNPFPGCEHVTRQWIPLTDLQVGESVTIRRVHEFIEENEELLNYLIENKVLPGSKTKVIEILPFNQTLTISVAKKPVTLGFQTAPSIFAERPGDPRIRLKCTCTVRRKKQVIRQGLPDNLFFSSSLPEATSGLHAPPRIPYPLWAACRSGHSRHTARCRKRAIVVGTREVWAGDGAFDRP